MARAAPWGFRLLFLVLVAAILFLRLLPLYNEPGSMPGPDLLQCLILAWMMRRPDILPIWLILPVILVEDLLLLRPPGLWAGLMVMATEFLRSRTALTRDLHFLVEWALAAGIMVAMMLLYRFAFILVLLPQPPIGFAAIQVIWSILAYPLVVGLSRLILGMQRAANGGM